MKLWKLKYMVKDKIEDLKDKITSPNGMLVIRVLGVAVVIWLIVKVLGNF